jgi:hypothetical protein
MQPNEALVLIGYKKTSKNKGYGWDVAYDGQEKGIKYELD